MNAEWIKSPTARRVMVHWADARPAWLWAQDGETLLWRNEAARFFHGKIKKHGVKLAPEAVPIKGQIARLIRLGSMGRSSLSRIQFLAGDRPISTTCTCTPLDSPLGGQALLIVGVDPIEPELLETRQPDEVDALAASLFPPEAEFMLISEDGQIASGTRHALGHYAPIIESEGLPVLGGDDSGSVQLGDEQLTLTRFKASPHDAILLLFEGGRSAAEAAAEIGRVRAEEGETGDDATADRPEATPEAEPLLPMGLPPTLVAPEPEATTDDPWVEPPPPVHEDSPQSLSSLFDRLADDDQLYTTLTAADEHFAGPVVETIAAPVEDSQEPTVAAEEAEAAIPSPFEETEPTAEAGADTELMPELPVEAVAAPIVVEAEPIPTEAELPPATEATGPTAEIEATEAEAAPELPAEVAAVAVEAEAEVPASAEETVPTPTDVIAALIAFADEEAEAEANGAATETLEAEPAETPAEKPVAWRIIGRGFVPLAPTATDAGGAETGEEEPAELPTETPDAETVERVSRYNFDELSRILSDRVSAAPPAPAEPGAARRTSSGDGALINLAGETFILNRLPLGILVFRDQQVLFANRALTELTGYESIESLRAGGLGAIFPAEAAAVAGPVTQIVKRDGTLVQVNARLQSITWHGKPALMLSAGAVESRIGHEGAVKTFAELAAATREEGFLTADRSGVVTTASLHGRILLGQTESDLIGRPLAALVEPGELGELKAFLERPARFAETARPAIALRGTAPDIEIHLFAEGLAGIVAGYFGFVRRIGGARPAVTPKPTAAMDEVEPSMLVRISRGVRRPLNTIIGFSDLIRSSAAGSVESQRTVEYAGDIKSAGQEIAMLVDELDDYARLRDGRYPAQADDIDLVALLETCVMRVRRQAGDARVLVRSAVSERLPRITADSASLTQAILNLLASAIDQTPVGGSVILSAQQEDDGAVIVNVRDNGETRTDLGERFVVFRDGVGKDGEALQPVRSSVGLALTRSLLAVNALSLSVDPTAGVGTLFSLVIPAELVKG